VQEGYGLTETSPVIAVRTTQKLVIGTVGPLYKDTEVRILDLNTGDILYPNPSDQNEGRGLKGEIHVRGPQVMKGYYKSPDATEKVLRDGWFNTGDIGIFTNNDCLKIVGRSKDTIVLLNGENIEPIPIESKICESPLVDQCMVVGQDQKQLGALVVPSIEVFQAESVAELSDKADIRDQIAADIRRLISRENGFKAFEHIQEIALLPKAFEIGDELTNTFKIKRHVVDQRYVSLISGLYH
jgi:long-chain acyl-CoA synthetase